MFGPAGTAAMPTSDESPRPPSAGAAPYPSLANPGAPPTIRVWSCRDPSPPRTPSNLHRLDGKRRWRARYPCGALFLWPEQRCAARASAPSRGGNIGLRLADPDHRTPHRRMATILRVPGRTLPFPRCAAAKISISRKENRAAGDVIYRMLSPCGELTGACGGD
jgi:hypothetical protein